MDRFRSTYTYKFRLNESLAPHTLAKSAQNEMATDATRKFCLVTKLTFGWLGKILNKLSNLELLNSTNQSLHPPQGNVWCDLWEER